MAVVVIDTIKPKNNGTFPVVEAVDVKVTNDKRLDAALNDKADQSDVTALQTAVAGKASQADLTALSGTVSGKQNALTEAQLAACDSGITSELVTQIGTNTTAIASKASASELTTATTNLQAQIDEIVTPVTQDAEVQNARVGEDSTPYTTLKNRLDFENSTIKENIRAIEECIGSIIDSYSIYSNAGTEEIDRQFVEANIYKGKTYKLVIDVPKNYTHSENGVVLNVRTTVTDDSSEIIDQITGEIRGTLTKGRHSYEFTATNDAQYLYVYINAAQQPVNLTVSLYNPSSVRDEIEYLNESLYGFIADNLGTIDYYDPNEIVRTYIPQPFVAGKKYTLLFKFAEEYTTEMANQVVFNARTTTDRDISTIVDQITEEFHGSIGKNELVYNFTPTSDANFLYVYTRVSQAHFVCDIRMIGEDVKTVIDKYSSGTQSAYKYLGERISMRQYSYDMNLKITTQKPSLFTNAWQGCAAYGDYLFRLVHTGTCAVYNAESGGTAISTFNLGSYSADNHANNANFGSNKYNVNDEFPLLYVTDGNSGEVMRCAVERITRNGTTFTSQKVQTIDLDQTDFETNGFVPYWGWSAWLIADNALYYFGCKYRTNGSQREYDAENVYIITKFKIPDLSNPTVTLTAADVIEQWTSPYDTELTQGGCIYGDYIFYAFGDGNSEDPSVIKVFSLSQKSSIAKMVLTGSPLGNVELEDLTIKDNKLVVAAQSDSIYEIDFA